MEAASNAHARASSHPRRARIALGGVTTSSQPSACTHSSSRAVRHASACLRG